MHRWLISGLTLFIGTLTYGQATSKFESEEIGVAFNYPNSWKLETNKLKKSTNHRFTFQTEKGAVVIEVYPVDFRAEKDFFQKSQLSLITSMKGQLEKQWEEEILGAPLLFTQYLQIKNDLITSYVSGLLYSYTPNKFFFRLSTAQANLDDAMFMWREVLQSLKSIYSPVLKPEDPTKPYPQQDGNPSPVGPNAVKIKGTPGTKTTKGEVAIAVSNGVEKATLYIPVGWSAKVAENTQIVELSHAKLSFVVSVKITNLLETTSVTKYLQEQSLASLKKFDTVKTREENAPKKNQTAAMYVAVWRSGSASNKPLSTLDMVGEFEQTIWHFNVSIDRIFTQEERALLIELIDLSIVIGGN